MIEWYLCEIIMLEVHRTKARHENDMIERNTNLSEKYYMFVVESLFILDKRGE